MVWIGFADVGRRGRSHIPVTQSDIQGSSSADMFASLSSALCVHHTIQEEVDRIDGEKPNDEVLGWPPADSPTRTTTGTKQQQGER